MGRPLILYAASDGHDGHPGHSLTHSGAAVGHQRPLSTWATRTDKTYPGGLTAILAPELTRDSVFDSLYNTRVYANSDHGRPFIEFTINDVSVGDGSFVQVPSSSTNRTIRILVAQDGAPAGSFKTSAASIVSDNWNPNWNAEIEILKNGELFETISINTPISEIELVDSEPITGTAYENYVERDGEYFINQYSQNPIDPAELTTNGKDFYILRVVGENGRHSYAGAIWVGL